MGPGLQPGMGRSRLSDGQASPQWRNGLVPVAILDRNEHNGYEAPNISATVSVRATMAPRLRVRLQCVQLRDQGWMVPQIAEQLAVSQATVRRALRRVRTGGLDALADQPKSGRPPRLSDHDLGGGWRPHPVSDSRTRARRTGWWVVPAASCSGAGSRARRPHGRFVHRGRKPSRSP